MLTTGARDFAVGRKFVHRLQAPRPQFDRAVSTDLDSFISRRLRCKRRRSEDALRHAELFQKMVNREKLQAGAAGFTWDARTIGMASV